MNLNIYNQQKGKLYAYLREISKVASYLENEAVYNSLAQSGKQLANEKFHLVVVGEFSRGKSTFVNAMLGRRLLPSSKKPTTAIITKIIYNEKPAYMLYYRESRKRPNVISEEEFFKLTAPKEVNEFDRSLLEKMFKQQQNLDDIKYAEVGYPLEICRNNVEVVDTPGTNDLNTGRIEITYNYIDKADAVIVVLAAHQALTQSEMCFLKERVIGNQIKDIFFVINYKDILHSADEEQDVINFVQENLQQVNGMPKNLRLHLVSSLQSLLWRRKAGGEILSPKQELRLPKSLAETGFPALEQEIASFLATEKGRVKIQKYVARAQEQIMRLNQDIDIQLDLASHSADEIKEKLRKMGPEFRRAKNEVERVSRQIRRNLENVIGELEQHCRMVGNDIRIAAQQAVDSYNADMSTTDVNEAIERAVTPIKKNFINKVMDIERKAVDNEIERANEALQAVWQDISLKYNHGFSALTLKLNCSDISIDTIEELRTAAGNNNSGTAWGGVIGAILGGVGGAIVGAMIGSLFDDHVSSVSNVKTFLKKKLNVHYRNETNNLLNQVKQSFDTTIDDVCNEFEQSVNERLNEMEEQLKISLREKESQELDAATHIQSLNAYKTSLKQVMDEMVKLIA